MPNTTIFADTMSEGIIVNGVVRLTLARVVTDGKLEPSGILAIPLTQVPNVINSLNSLMRQVETRIRENQAQQETPQKAPDALPNSFSFTHKN